MVMEQGKGPNKFNLRPHQEELLQLSELAGMQADPNLLKIIVELLNMQVPPQTIYFMLKTIRKSSNNHRRSGGGGSKSRTSI